MLHRKFNNVNNYVIHLEGHVHPVAMVGTLVYEDEETSPLLQPSPRSKKVLVGDKGVDITGLMSGRITDYKVYEALEYLEDDDDVVTVIDDNGDLLTCHISWFKEIYLYDEDETLLTCRDIEFKVGDYIDLRKHTPEQIRHIAEYYKFYDLNELLDKGSWDIVELDEYDGFIGSYSDSNNLSEEYSYNDIFYLGEV